jgi:radical SAM superfamily enzyme YgiQ (UPF0313 family)
LTAMAMFPQEEFEIMKLQDLNIDPLDEYEISRADIIATSSMIIHEDSHNQIIDLAHKHNKKVLAGGPFPTTSVDRNKNVDYIVAGEAEATLLPFIEDYLTGKANRLYTEESVRDRINTKLTRSGKPDLIQTPIPRWDLIKDISQYYTIGLQFSRGCPYDCEFCNITSLFGKESRTKTSEQMIKEFDVLNDMGYKGGIFLLDDNFIGNIKNLKPFLKELIKWQKQKNYAYSISTEASMDLAWPKNKQVLDDMVCAGFDAVFLGIESVDQQMIMQMNKKQNLKISPYEAVKTIQNAGIEVTGGFIVGTDGEKKDVFKNLFKFVQETGIVLPMAGLLGVIPGTKLEGRLKSEGRLKGQTSGSNTHSFELDYIPRLEEGFSEEQLISGYRQLLKDLFNPKNYYDRCRVLQKEKGENHSKEYSISEGLGIIARFIKHQLKGNANIETGKYLIESLVKHPRYFPKAVTHAVKFQHLKEITKESIKAEDYLLKIETMYDDFTEKIQETYNKYHDNLQKASLRISEKADKLVKKAEKYYNKIHPDFLRENHYTALQSLKERIMKKEYLARA